MNPIACVFCELKFVHINSKNFQCLNVERLKRRCLFPLLLLIQVPSFMQTMPSILRKSNDTKHEISD